MSSQKIRDTLTNNNINYHIDILNALDFLPKDKQILFSTKLASYRFVDEIYQLHLGKYIRWVTKNEQSLKIGGFVVDIKFLDMESFN